MRRREWIVFAAATIFAVLASHNICDLLFRCGCTFLSVEGCNMHHAAGPHCPWCMRPTLFFSSGALWLGGTYAALRLVKGRRLPLLIAAALLGFCAGVLISGVLTVAISGYPHFLIRSS